MEKNVLFELLSALNRKELKGFKQFLSSPYFNSRKDVSDLFECYLAKSSFIYPKLDKQLLFKKIYPDQKYNDAKLRHLLSYLSKLVKTYYAQLNYESDEINQKINLIEQLKQKGINKSFDNEWKKAKKQLESQVYRDAHFYYQKHLLLRQKSEQLFKLKRQGEFNNEQIISDLQIFYVARFLKQSCSILTFQKMSAQDDGFDQLDKILETVSQFDLTKTPIIAAYYFSVLTLKHPEKEENYKSLIELLRNHAKLLPPIDLRDIHLIAINYCIKKLNEGNRNYIREAFELYKSGLKNEVLFENRILSPFTYKNILKLGLELKEYDWTESYLDEYQHFLNPKNSENHYTYCRAVFHFNTSNYPEVLSLLQKVSFGDKLYELDARRMRLIIYYEQGAYDSLASLLDSFRTYIHRQKNLGYHKENYINLIHFVKKFLKSNLDSKATRKELITEINETKALADRRWLLEILK